MITEGILEAMARIDGGNWFELPNEPYSKTTQAFLRRLRLCVKYRWVMTGRAVTPKATAYRLTPRGMAVLDRHALTRMARRGV